MAKNWIAGAIRHPGALTRKAKRVGESPMAFAQSHKGAKGTTGKQARLAITLSHLRGSGPFSKADAARGYKLMTAPAYVSALGEEKEGGENEGKQQVKGVNMKRTTEAKQVAGRS